MARSVICEAFKMILKKALLVILSDSEISPH